MSEDTIMATPFPPKLEECSVYGAVGRHLKVTVKRNDDGFEWEQPCLIGQAQVPVAEYAKFSQLLQKWGGFT